MALVYCSFGKREYGKKPIGISSRGYWEFQCNISGPVSYTHLTLPTIYSV